MNKEGGEFLNMEELLQWAIGQRETNSFLTLITKCKTFFTRDWQNDNGRLALLGGDQFDHCFATVWWCRVKKEFACSRMVKASNGFCFTEEELVGTDWIPSPSEVLKRAKRVRDSRTAHVNVNQGDWYGHGGPEIKEIVSPCLR